MSSELKLRRGSTAAHSTFTGADGEVTFDTDKNVVVSHDGATVGGFPHTKAADLAASGGSALVSYLPAGTGAVATDIQSKLRESVSAFDFMTAEEVYAVKNNFYIPTAGATISSVSASVQAAIAHLGGLGGGQLHFATGNWKFNVELGTNRVDILGSGNPVFHAANTNMPIISQYSLSGGGITISNISFASTGLVGTAIYINSYGSNRIFECSFSGFEYAIYSNSSEWQVFSGCHILQNFCGIAYVTKNNDIFGRSPLFNQHPTASTLNDCMITQNTVGIFIDCVDRANDKQINIRLNTTDFLSNQLHIGARNGGLPIYMPMVINGGWFEASPTSGTVSIQGYTLNKGVMDISGGAVVLRDCFWTGTFTFNDCAVFGYNISVQYTGATVTKTGNTIIKFNGVRADAPNLTFAECQNVTLNVSLGLRSASWMAPRRGGFVKSRDQNVSRVKHCAYGTALAVWSGTATQQYVNGDGFYSNTCLEVSGVVGDVMANIAPYVEGKYYVSTFLIRSTTDGAKIHLRYYTAGVAGLSDVVLPVTADWQQYVSIANTTVTNGSGYTGFVFDSTATIRLSCMQVVGFTTYNEAVSFANSDTYYLADTAMRELQGTTAPTLGSYLKGDIVWNSNPIAAGTVGWICTVAGTPGTWKTFGSISA